MSETTYEITGAEPHGQITTSGLWRCEQDSRDGEHHYFVKATS